MTDTTVVDFEPPAPRAERRFRERRQRRQIDKAQIVERVFRFFHDDQDARSDDIDARIQRYAKFRQWTEGKDWPWPDSSDAAVPDLMTQSLRQQDTFHNAVMQRRPAVSAIAIDKKQTAQQSAIDQLLDYQFFTEQPGEDVVGELAEAFVNDGVYYAFVPWVRETRPVSDAKLYDPIPTNLGPARYFRTILAAEFPDDVAIMTDVEGWDWRLSESESTRIRFYTKGRSDVSEVEMVIETDEVVYDGPVVQVLAYEDVLYPIRSGNLQAPGPSNPHGAPHVILVSYPTVDEVRSLARRGVYQLTEDELNALDTVNGPQEQQEPKDQKDALAGQEEGAVQRLAQSHQTVTRLTCFDRFDVNDDGRDEDMVWTVILEIKALARMKAMGELYPLSPARRPLVSRSFLPVQHRVTGISLLEALEGLHDVLKMTLDQTIDNGTLNNAPWGFYRPSGSMKPETIRLWAGELYPVGNPSQDVAFPRPANNNEAFGFNLMTVVNQMEERLSTQGDLQLGRVPPGRSSALRTASGMALLAGQGEARPERLLRRFFRGLTEIFELMHGLNQAHISDEKKIVVTGVLDAREDPYKTVKRDAIKGNYLFTFDANVLNTSKAAIGENLEALAGMYINALTVQLGLIDGDGIYRLLRDIGKARGQEPAQYLREPQPDAGKPRLTAEDAIRIVLTGVLPDGVPLEGALAHLEKLIAFEETDGFGNLFDEQATRLALYAEWKETVQQRAIAEVQQQQLAQAAQSAGIGAQPGQPGRPANAPPASLENPQLSGGAEMLDETMPSAGGGGGQ